MYLEHREPHRTAMSLRNEIDLLLHCPFGGLIGGGKQLHDHAPAAAQKISVKPRQVGRNKNVKRYWDFKNLDFFYNHPDL